MVGVRGFIDDVELRVAIYMISAAQEPLRRRGLKRLCDQLNAGRFPKDTAPLDQIVRGCLFDTSDEVKIWALKAVAAWAPKKLFDDALIARLGTTTDSVEVTIWAIAALFTVLTPKEVQRQIDEHQAEVSSAVKLATLVYGATIYEDDLAANPIDLDDADEITLKIACILFGLGRSAKRFVHPDFDNEEMVGVLFGSNYPVVSQYSCWALWENPIGKSEHLLIDPDEMLKRAANVRRWGYPLLVKTNDGLAKSLRTVSDASFDKDDDARLGLAEGLIGRGVDGLDEITVQWFSREPLREAKVALLRHFASKPHMPMYRDCAIAEYQRSETTDVERQQILLAARNTTLYAELQKSELIFRQPDLIGFEGVGLVNINIGPGANVQNIAVGNNNSQTYQNFRLPKDAALAGSKAIDAVLAEDGLTAEQRAALASAKDEVTEGASADVVTKISDMAKKLDEGMTAGTSIALKLGGLASWAATILAAFGG